jgi:hypothetical protein
VSLTAHRWFVQWSRLVVARDQNNATLRKPESDEGCTHATSLLCETRCATRGRGSPQILGAFSHRSAQALRSLIPAQERSLFAQTGLKISTCRKLMERVRAYWERHRETINQFLTHFLDEDILRDVASIIYNLQDSEVDPAPVRVSPRKTITPDHVTFFVDWIWFDDSDRSYQHFREIKDKSPRAQAFTSMYVMHSNTRLRGR